jgi:hypothetical protein
MKTYTEKRFFDWYEDEKSVSIRANSGSYGGGGSEVFVVEIRPPPCALETTKEWETN